MYTVTDKVRFIENIFGSSKFDRSFKNLDVRCPICNPTDKNKRKLSIFIEDDRNHCWTCGWRSRTLAPLIAKYAGKDSLAEYINKFAKHLKNHSNILDAQETKQKEIVRLPNDFKLLFDHVDYSPDRIAVFNYAKIKRNLSDSIILKYSLGTSNDAKWKRRLIVPSFDSNGNLNYYIGRAIDSKVYPKYEALGIERHDVIFNEINIDWSKPVIICEGVFDMFSCGDNSIPLLGSDINENSLLFSKLLVNSSKVYLSLDGDMWYKKTLKIAKKLSSYNIDVFVVDTRSIEDPGSVSHEHMKELISKAKNISWEDRVFEKLNIASNISLSI